MNEADLDGFFGEPISGEVPSITNGQHFPSATKEQVAAASAPGGIFRIWTPEEIWAPLPPPDYLVDGLLIRGSLSLIAAYGSSLKTWMLEDMALSVATGRPWLGRYPVKQGRALIVDFESGDYELRRRAHRIAAARSYTTPVEGFAFVTMPELNLTDERFFGAIKPLMGEYDFIGIDSLSAGQPGMDENDTRFAGSLNRLKSLANNSKCVVDVLHHSKKTGGDNGGTARDDRMDVRGTSAIFNACDIVMTMTKSKDSVYVVKHIKARGGKTIDPFAVRIDDVGEHGSLVVGYDVPADEQEAVANSSGSINKVMREILILLAQEHGLTSKNQVYSRIHGTKAARVAGMDELVEKGLIREHMGTWRISAEVL